MHGHGEELQQGFQSMASTVRDSQQPPSLGVPLLEPAALDALLKQYSVPGVQIAAIVGGVVATQTAGLSCQEAKTPMFDSTWLEIASLSKTLAAAYMCEHFSCSGNCSVNSLLREAGSKFLLRSVADKPQEWAERVTLDQLVNHTALGMHYVHGIPLSEPFPRIEDLISGTESSPAPFGYASIDLTKEPGMEFSYSGGGFLVLQHLLELRERKPIAKIMEPFLAGAGTAVFQGLSFEQDLPGKQYACGYREDGSPIKGGRLAFPPLAAGGLGTAGALADWLRQLALAYKLPEGCGSISHATARKMLEPGPDLGSEGFMRARMGLGVFVFEAGSPGLPSSRWMLHQAANDGFRGVYLLCFDGPDAALGPQGFVVLSNSDNNAMLLNCAVMRMLLQSKTVFRSPLRGLDWSKVPNMQGGFSTQGMEQEQIVNSGIRDLVLAAFVKPRSRKRQAIDM